MDSTNRAHLSGALIATWVTRIDELEAGRRAAVLKALATAMPEPTRWQNRRTTANLMVTLSETPELCLDYGGHRFPEDYDIEAFRRFMIALCATPKQPVVPADIAALHWGTIGDDGESNKSRATVARFLAPLLPPEPVAEKAATATITPYPSEARLVNAIAELANEITRLNRDVTALQDRLADMMPPAGIAQEFKALRDINSKLGKRVSALEHRSGFRFTVPPVVDQLALELEPGQRLEVPGRAPLPPPVTTVNIQSP